MSAVLLEGARTHNLQGVSLTLEFGEVVAISGVSGSGKSSLAVDTLYAEGQRRFVESFSPYARQFLERLERPPVDRLDPVPAGIAVDRRAPVKSSRSTVATMADLEPYLAALFAREAVPICPDHGAEAALLDALGAAERANHELSGERAVVTYPVRVAGAEAYLELRERLIRDGYRRLWIGDKALDLDSVKPSVALGTGTVEVVVDRVAAAPDRAKRLASAIESAWSRAMGVAHVYGAGARVVLQTGFGCPTCGKALGAPHSGLFSYESPLGACSECRGFGRTLGIDLEKVIPDVEKSLEKFAIRPWSGKSTKWERKQLAKLCRRHAIPMDRPWRALRKAHRKLVLEGDGSWHVGKFPGVLGWFSWLETRTYKMHVRVFLSRYRAYDVCSACQGKRLNASALSYRVAGISLADWHALEVGAAKSVASNLCTRTGQGDLAKRELLSRLEYLERVGLGYLTLNRQARTLSGGEAQRVTLTAALGTSLHNALFVLDEPTVGLHASDVEPLGAMIRELAARNNCVLVVEHDAGLLRAADRLIELGPGAGMQGGRIGFDGAPSQVAAGGGALSRALFGRSKQHALPRRGREVLRVRGARANNLAGFDVDLPLGVLCAVTGPSGSGKSTLAVDIVYRALARRLGAFDLDLPGAHDAIEGGDSLRRVTLVDQSPLGRTSRGNAATYTKAWDLVRALYAKEPAAVAHEFQPAHFSFNVTGGRCDACSGEGHETVEMQFLADVRLVCPSCRGQRFKEEVLRVQHRGKSIAELLDTTVDEVLELYRSEPGMQRTLGPVSRLGLGYLRIGQPLSTLSGGEAQRLKLARALADEHTGSLLVLDEPSAGLHVDEIDRLLGVLGLIVDAGGSVIVIDHDLDVIASADFVIDLGPGAGAQGGQIVASGTPAEIAHSQTRTGRALRERHAAGQSGLSTHAKPYANAQSASAALSVVRAREHNLRDVSVSIPHRALTVVTGPSGSGKSTLAFDVVFAEGQRRFLETLTPYARQFLPTMPRPDVDRVTGVPPSIALEQRTTRAGPMSSVATVTEVAHYLRLLYAKAGVPHCPDHDQPITCSSRAAILARVQAARSAQMLLAPVVQARKGTYLDVFTAAAKSGISKAICDGALVSTDDPPKLTRSKEHSIDLVLLPLSDPGSILAEDIARALRWGKGALKLRSRTGSELLLSTSSACPVCGLSLPELDPRWFSFNTKQGRCADCEGQGVTYEERRGKRGRATEFGVRSCTACTACAGSRLAPIPRAVRLRGERYHELLRRSVRSVIERVKTWQFSGDESRVALPVVRELERRLCFLADVGLDYLSLDRAARTLSGGEISRLRLAAQLGAGLTGALYVLDEPTIGLHACDTQRLLGNLKKLVEIGSTVLVVEHDADTIRAADYLLDLGPGGGSLGGLIVAEGSPAVVLANEQSPTGRALLRPPALRSPLAIEEHAEWLTVSGASQNNLQDVELRIPIARFSVVAGVSGSGKSTLVRQVLLPALRRKLGLVADEPGEHRSLSGYRRIKRAVAVDQSPIGRTPRSVPATFLGIWDVIRQLFASTPEAQVLGFKAARFSFNTTQGGRCTTCEGQGVITHEMSFLPDVVTPCAACEGKRFEPRTLDVRYMGLSIGDVLELSAEEAASRFRNHPNVRAPLSTLTDMGAGYVKLGQGSHTLSGGEAQRLKLALELTASVRHEPTLYVLDEPTTGLHLADVAKLMDVLSRLVERGDTLVVIEHHPAVIAGADFVVELGPGGGERGGTIVGSGPARQLSRIKTPTGSMLKEFLRAY